MITLGISDKLAQSIMCVTAPVEKLTEEEREKLHKDQEKRSKKYGIGIKERTNLTPPKGFPEDPEDYADPVNYRYPIDDKHIRAALTYWNVPKNRTDYTDAEQAIILERIITAALASDEIETVSFQDDDPLYATLPKKIKEQLAGFDTEKSEKTKKRTPLVETNLGDITPSALQEANDMVLMNFHKFVHDSEGVGELQEDILQAHMFVVEELLLRDIGHEILPGNLDDTLPTELKSASSLNIFVPIFKRDDEERLVYGVVYTPDVVDAHGDIADAEVIKKTAHLFLQEYNQTDIMHDEDNRPDIYVVESYIAPVDFELNGQKIAKGAWVLVLKIMNDKIWEQVKSGELTGYSLGGIIIGIPIIEEAA